MTVVAQAWGIARQVFLRREHQKEIQNTQRRIVKAIVSGNFDWVMKEIAAVAEQARHEHWSSADVNVVMADGIVQYRRYGADRTQVTALRALTEKEPSIIGYGIANLFTHEQRCQIFASMLEAGMDVFAFERVLQGKRVSSLLHRLAEQYPVHEKNLTWQSDMFGQPRDEFLEIALVHLVRQKGYIVTVESLTHYKINGPFRRNVFDSLPAIIPSPGREIVDREATIEMLKSLMHHAAGCPAADHPFRVYDYPKRVQEEYHRQHGYFRFGFVLPKDSRAPT